MDAATRRDILIKTRNKISDPNRWTKEQLAKDKDGNYTSPTAPDATCWCIAGAVMTTGIGITGEVEIFDYLNKKANALRNDTTFHIATLNDEFTHEQVMAFLDAIIEETV